ncbi:hypothetical protein QQF64_018515 [Cirrhinus molitorella]|uniref:Uncharacterized protein n=1 Tax=Cirrhinus molitorella TaxID=172907 RepID=A0ABR3LGA4_9TELE
MKKSHSCRFGDMTTCDNPISVFLRKAIQKSTKAQLNLQLTDLTHAREVPFKILKHQIETEPDADRRQDLIRKHEDLHQTKAKIERRVEAIRQRFRGSVVEDFSGGAVGYRYTVDSLALKTVAEHFRTTCFDWHKDEFQMALSHMHVFAHLCACGVKAESVVNVNSAVISSRRVFSVVGLNKTKRRNSLALDGTLSSIMTIKMANLEPCFKWEPPSDIIKASKKTTGQYNHAHRS